MPPSLGPYPPRPAPLMYPILTHTIPYCINTVSIFGVHSSCSCRSNHPSTHGRPMGFGVLAISRRWLRTRRAVYTRDQGQWTGPPTCRLSERKLYRLYVALPYPDLHPSTTFMELFCQVSVDCSVGHGHSNAFHSCSIECTKYHARVRLAGLMWDEPAKIRSHGAFGERVLAASASHHHIACLVIFAPEPGPSARTFNSKRIQKAILPTTCACTSQHILKHYFPIDSLSNTSRKGSKSVTIKPYLL